MKVSEALRSLCRSPTVCERSLTQSRTRQLWSLRQANRQSMGAALREAAVPSCPFLSRDFKSTVSGPRPRNKLCPALRGGSSTEYREPAQAWRAGSDCQGPPCGTACATPTQCGESTPKASCSPLALRAVLCRFMTFFTGSLGCRPPSLFPPILLCGVYAIRVATSRAKLARSRCRRT